MAGGYVDSTDTAFEAPRVVAGVYRASGYPTFSCVHCDCPKAHTHLRDGRGRLTFWASPPDVTAS